MKTFFRLLRKTPRRWKVNEDGAIRLRYGRNVCCPITAIPATYLGVFVDVDSTLGLEKALQLLHWEREALVTAADQRELTPLRKKLLKACGLREKP